MKRATALFSLISLVFLFLAPAYGESLVSKPDLPQDYESWQYKLTHSCANVTEKVWAKTNLDKRIFEYVSVFEFSGKIVSYEYTVDYLRLIYRFTYLAKGNQWLKMDVTSAEYYINFQDKQLEEFIKNGLNVDVYKKCIANFEDEFSEFILHVVIF